MIREQLLLHRIVARAREDASADVYLPDDAVLALMGLPRDPFDPAKNLEHRRIQQARISTGALEDLRDDEIAERRARPLRSISGHVATVAFCILADAGCITYLCRSQGLGPVPSLITGAAFAPSFIWLASNLQNPNARWLARIGLVIVIVTIVALRLQTLPEDATSDASAMAVFFGALTILPALFGESQARELRARLRARVTIGETASRRRAAEKRVAESDARAHTIREAATADDRLWKRLIAAYNREWKVTQARRNPG